MVNNFTKIFRQMNCKERFYVANMLYAPKDTYKIVNSTIDLDFPGTEASPITQVNDVLVQEIRSMLGLAKDAALVAHGIDYHLDWIDAAIQIAKNFPDAKAFKESKAMVGFKLEEMGKSKTGQPSGEKPKPTEEGMESNKPASNLDSDVVFVYESTSGIDLVFIEVKAYADWGPDQLQQKIDRITEIFGDQGRDHSGYTPHLVLIDLIYGNTPTMPSIKEIVTKPWVGNLESRRLHFSHANWEGSYALSNKGNNRYGLK